MPGRPQLRFVFSARAKDTIVDLLTPDRDFHLKKYTTDTSQSAQELSSYTGIYYSPELDCNYGIVLKDGHLVLTNVRYNDAKISFINNDHLQTGHWWMRHLVMLRNNKGKIIGFEINSGNVMHLRFNKTD